MDFYATEREQERSVSKEIKSGTVDSPQYTDHTLRHKGNHIMFADLPGNSLPVPSCKLIYFNACQ